MANFFQSDAKASSIKGKAMNNKLNSLNEVGLLKETKKG
jgi:hypothetical protein